MAFGCAHSADLRASTENSETSVYFQKAWALLPNLLMDNDLWALKAMTLIVNLLARLVVNGKPFSINSSVRSTTSKQAQNQKPAGLFSAQRCKCQYL